MKKISKSIIDNYLETIIILFSMLMIAFMITGGCNGDGNKPRPTPLPTGFPPECLPFEVDPECPAVSLPELRCVSYSCIFSELNPDLPEPETFSLGININECVSLDCFNLECEEFIADNLPEIIVFNIQDITNGGSLPPTFSGIADIDGDEFDFYCVTAVP
jgi:hypothetical protein